MSSAHYFLLALFALLFPLLTVATEKNAPSPDAVGAWKPITNLSDPHVKEIAEFAVSEYNKRTQKSLVFQAVLRGESQIQSGTAYRLLITAKSHLLPPIANYEAVVLEKPWAKLKKLLSFAATHD